MKKYGRPRRKHRQNKRAKNNIAIERVNKFFKGLFSARLFTLYHTLTMRENWEKGNRMEFEPGGIIAKGPNECSGEYIVTPDRANGKGWTEIPGQSKTYTAELKLTGIDEAMIERLRKMGI